MPNFACIYNPKTNHSHFYEASDKVGEDLFILSFNQSKQICFTKSNQSFPSHFSLNSTEEISTDEKDYVEWVEQIIDKIDRNELRKGVAAQKQVVKQDASSLDLEQLYNNLIHQLPNTFVYLFYIENTIWFGASPEIVGVREGNTFVTISLAGTNLEGKFSKKEEEEQNIVSDYILHTMGNQIQTDSILTQPIKFGNLSHLVSEFSMEVDNQFDFDKMIRSIHPSPALSGFPKDLAVDFILKNEPIDREFYSGLVSFSENGNNYSFATIRCAKITQNQLIFYAGAGITIDSNPRAEWQETLDKINILKNLLIG